MLRFLTGLAAMALTAGSALAGELDGEFAGKKVSSPIVAGKTTSSAAGAVSAKQQSATDKAGTSELDQESPTQAYRRGGWGGGWRGGWGGGWRGGWGGYYRGWGGYYGGRRPWGYWGSPYVNLSFGYPYYGYPYYPTYYGYPAVYSYYY